MLESIKDVGQASGPIIVGIIGIKEGFAAITFIILLSLLTFAIMVKSGRDGSF